MRAFAVAGGLALAFAARLAYGLCQQFWSEDERQVYLIGLRSFARGEWPYFGADVVWTGGQLPGALQGWLVRAPLELWAAPEAPFVLLNTLSFAALAGLAWYLSRRYPTLPRWLIWGALLTLPWTLNYSTHVVNTSYVLVGGIMFFVGVFEGTRPLRTGALPLPLAWALMGAGLLAVVQLHMSWVLLPPYVAVAGLSLLRSGDDRRHLPRAISGFLAGAVVTGSLLVPTLLAHGLTAGAPGEAIAPHVLGPQTLVTILARVLSLVSFETARFLGLSTAERLYWLWRMPWAAPFVVVVTIAGVLQPLWLAAVLFTRGRQHLDWSRTRALFAGTIVLVFVSFCFSVRGPQAHSLYVVFPVAALFACSSWQRLETTWASGTPRLRRAAAAALLCGAIMHVAIAVDKAPRRSLYVDRPLIATAIATRNDRLLGDRRDSLQQPVDRQPRVVDRVVDLAAYLAADPVVDLKVIRSTWDPVVGRRVSRFVITLANRSRAAAYLDVRYATRYFAADGRELGVRDGVVKEIVQPGAERTWTEITDGFTPAGASAATVEITGAEKCIPVPK